MSLYLLIDKNTSVQTDLVHGLSVVAVYKLLQCTSILNIKGNAHKFQFCLIYTQKDTISQTD